MFDLLTETYGPDSRNRLDETHGRGDAGASAALETFYHALNHADLDVLTAVWADDPLVQIDNPVGGILRGRSDVTDLYRRIFGSGLDLRVTFGEAVSYRGAETLVVSGREVGSYADGGRRVPLTIRTTRVLADTRAGWRMIHHHGSLDDAAALAAYQRAVHAGS